MSNFNVNSNSIFLQGLKNRDYSLINHAIDLGAPIYDNSSYSHRLLFKSWHSLIQLGDIGLIQLVDNAYPFKPSHHFQNLLTSIIINNKECFDFFLKKCIHNKVDLNNNFGIILSNTCKVSPHSTYEDDFKKHFTSEYYLSKLLDNSINLTIPTTHPLVILADNNNFHSWQLLYQYMKKQDTYNFIDNKQCIIHSFYKFLDTHSFSSDEVQFFFKEFNQKTIFSYGLKKVSHPSYKGNNLDIFCLEMFSQEPELFLQKSKTLGKNNLQFSSAVKKIILFHNLDTKLSSTSIKSKGIKI